MQLRYLPIGSVCSIDNSNNKYMVIGYKKNDFDFVSVLYPDGFLDKDNLIYFNEGQITEIYSLGYKDEYGIMYSKKINIEEKPVVEIQSGDGVEEDKSVFEGTYEIDEDVPELTNEIVEESDNKPVDVDELVQNEATNTQDEMTIIKNDSPYIFNSEGLVVAIKPEEKKEETKEESVSPYVFDENGTIIAVNMPSTESKEQEQVQSTSPYVFDENGTIIAVNEPTTETQQEVQEQQVEKVENPKYKFDENGFLVAVE